jgi:hypothetical protein
MAVLYILSCINFSPIYCSSTTAHNETNIRSKEKTNDGDKNSKTCNLVEKERTCSPQKKSPQFERKESEEIQVLSEDNSPKEILPVHVLANDIIANDSMAKDILSKDILQIDFEQKNMLLKDILPEDIMSQNISPQEIMSRDISPEEILAEEIMIKKTLSKQEEEKTRAQLEAATRSILTNLILGIIFVSVLSTLVLVRDLWRPYFYVAVFTIMRGLMPLLTAIANFGTVKSVAWQYWKYIRHAIYSAFK